jgi:molybdate transport system substrate-binding protein
MRCSPRKSATTTSCSLALLLVLAACSQDPRPQVFVAASLHRAVADVIDELGLEARLSTAASSTLARQIEHGAPAAVFLSANWEWMDYLAARNLLINDTRRTLVTNQMVWIYHDPWRGEPKGRLAIGDPTHVPVGRYAKDYLEAAGLWDDYEDRILPAPDAPSVVRLVQRGEAMRGIAYSTDARNSGLKVVTIDGVAPKVSYECAVVKPDSTAARRIYEALTSERAARIYARHGFEPHAR